MLALVSAFSWYHLTHPVSVGPGATSVFSRYILNQAVGGDSGADLASGPVCSEVAGMGKWLAQGWCFWSWAVNTGRISQNSLVKWFACLCFVFLLLLELSSCFLCCLPGQQFCNRIKGMPQFPKIDVQELYCPAEGGQNVKYYIVWGTYFQCPLWGFVCRK